MITQINVLDSAKPEEEIVIISLHKKNISSMLGSLRMGAWLENWCAGLTMTSIGTCDTRSMKWRGVIEYIIDQIKLQTGIQDEWKEYGENDGVIEEILKLVNERGATLGKTFDNDIERQCQEHQEEICNKSNQ